MKFFRSKVISICLLVLFVQSIFAPTYVHALTTGPHQPEYTSYEEPGASDMVNLLTGDFTFSLPILEVPGPEGSFSLPLSYHGGIGLDQEASWVGLGFTLNAGNISRAINQFPDDAAGESQTVTVKDLTGVYGYHMSNGFWSAGWNNQTGSYGSVSLFGIVSAEWQGNRISSVGVAGVSMSGGQVDFDPVQFMSAVITIASWGAAGSAAAAEAAAANGATAADIAAQATAAVNKAIVMDVLSTAASAAAGNVFSSGGTPSAPTSGYWEYSKKTKRIGIAGKSYRIWLDKTRNEKMYGALYLGKVSQVPVNQSTFPWMNLYLKNGSVSETLNEFPKGTGSVNEGAASDINYDQGSNYITINNSASLALDDYTVRAPGISGTIMPYRVDVGSVSMPRQMTKWHVRLNPIKYLDYKVPFIYEGMVSNSHFHNTGGNTAPTAPGFYCGISTQVGNTDPSQNTALTYDLIDVVFKNQRIKSGLSSTAPKIGQANHIEWLTNEDIKLNYPYTSKFIDCLPASDRNAFRSNFSFSSPSITSSTSTYSDNFSTTIQLTSSVIGSFYNTMPVTLNVQFYDDAASRAEGVNATFKTFNVAVQSVDNVNNRITVTSDSEMVTFYGKYADIEVRYAGSPQIQKAIGGYCITGVDGVTYHFALPVYDYDAKTEIIDANDSNKESIIFRGSPFANNWLLTAITGPDFIDRNDNGLADDGDWGYWVKLNYGNHADDFQWRLPYADYKRSTDNLYDSYSQGLKQMYYLNSIETRSYVALFLKSVRDDSRSLNSRTSLKLDEICLIGKETYKKLITPTGQGGLGIPDYSNKLAQVCLSSSFGSGSNARNFLDLNAMKRILFTYTYDLCPNTPNAIVTSANPSQGKLTLSRLSILGRNSAKTVPDYKFQYGPNPPYNANYWDGWSYYNPSGTSSYASHKTPQTGAGDGTAWSLTKIITPLGSEIIVNQERDTYSSVSGQTLYTQDFSYGYGYSDVDAETDLSNNRVRSSAALVQGDKVLISGSIEYKCSMNSSFEVKEYSGELTVDHSDGTYVYFTGFNYPDIPCPTAYDVQQNTGVFKAIIPSRKGGNLRVGSIVNTDGFGGENKIQYLYEGENGKTSGIVAREPEYIKDQAINFDDIPGYPFTPVLYSRVSVLTGKLTSFADYNTKYVYEFEPPSSSLLVVQKVTIKPRTEVYNAVVNPVPGFKEYVETYQHNITDNTSKIGRLNKVSVYDKNGEVVSKTDMIYTSDQILNSGVNNYQGVYSESVLMFDRVTEYNLGAIYNKSNRTTTISYPNTLQKMISTRDGFTSETRNLSWDFVSGIVLQKLDKSASGLITKTVTKPAYEVYPQMGPKASSMSNKNMLSASAAEYVYRSDDVGTQLGIIAASVQTWKNSWNNYRYHNGTSYTESPAETMSTANPVWRKSTAYVWKGSYAKLRPEKDGTQTFTSSDDFNFASGTNPLWQYAGEVLRFDHFSMPLETKSEPKIGNQMFGATKMGYDNRKIIAQASNAKYNEIAFTSAEDEIAGIGYFGGEVAKKDASGNAIVVRKSQGADTHTGDCALSLSTGTGFVYKPAGLTTSKTYRAAAWTNSANGRLYYKLNGLAEVLSPAPVAEKKAGNWYLLNLSIPIGSTFTSLEVGVKSVSGVAVFDDFRFQPADAVMTCYVSNPLDFEFTITAPTYSPTYDYVLNNDNLFTKYEYNEKGQLVKQYQESFQYDVKLISESKDDYRRFHVDQ
jgi:hypothetical protein